MMTMNGSLILRIVATLCFLLACFSVAPAGIPMVPLGLAFWCISTMV